jgi:peptide deformylase
MIYPIVIYGSQVLRNQSVEITPDYPEFQKLIEDMFLTLDEASGVGLAAPQIGKNIRLFIVDCTPWAEDVPELANFRRVFVNPEIYERSEQTDLFEEGCLSLPGIHENVSRPVKIRMRYLDENFVQHDEWVEGYLARVMQHEFDHLEGKVFSDRLSPLRRQMNKNKLGNLAKGKVACDYKVKRVMR